MWENFLNTEEWYGLLPPLPAVVRRTRLYLQGDYWQNENGWAGIRVPYDARNRSEIVEDQFRAFTPQPMIEEVNERHVNGVVGREPSFSWALTRVLEVADEDDETEADEYTPNELNFLAEINAATGNWWDKHRVQEIVKVFTTGLVSEGEAVMRMFVPPGLIDEFGQLKKKNATWLDALDVIYLEAPDFTVANVTVNAETMKPASYFLFGRVLNPSATIGNSKLDTPDLATSTASVTPLAVRTLAAGAKANGSKAKETLYFEVSFVNESNLTVLRIIEAKAKKDATANEITGFDEVEQDLGGEIYITRAARKPLITDAVQRNQNSLNVMNTMTLHNGNIAGNRERNFINLQPPTAEIVDASSPSGKRRVPAPMETGPGAVNFLSGLTYTDINGQEKIAQGSVVVTEPVSPEPLLKAAQKFEQNIYKATKQFHIAMTGDGSASAVSRVQARADFAGSLLETSAAVEGVIRSRLLAVLMLACHLAGDSARAERIKNELRVRVDCRLDVGPLTPEEREATLALYAARLISRETAQVLLNIEDVDSELQKIRDEDKPENWSLQKKLEALALLAGPAVTNIKAAAMIVGFTEKEANDLAKGDFAPNENDV